MRRMLRPKPNLLGRACPSRSLKKWDISAVRIHHAPSIVCGSAVRDTLTPRVITGQKSSQDAWHGWPFRSDMGTPTPIGPIWKREATEFPEQRAPRGATAGEVWGVREIRVWRLESARRNRCRKRTVPRPEWAGLYGSRRNRPHPAGRGTCRREWRAVCRPVG